MASAQGRFALLSLAKYRKSCYQALATILWSLIMFSQRKLSNPSDRGFVQMIWNAILLIQTRETSSLMTGRER
jgi:hypothetical protein